MSDNKIGETPSSKQKYAELLKTLENKAELSSCAYLMSSEKLKRKSNWFLCGSLLAGIILGCTSVIIPFIINMNGNLSVIIGTTCAFSAIGISIFSLSDKIFGWGEKIASYEVGFQIWRSYIRDSQWFRKNELLLLDEDMACSKSNNLQQKYSAFVSSLPPNSLTDREFLECKKQLMLKIKISKKLSANPCIDIDKAYQCYDENNMNRD